MTKLTRVTGKVFAGSANLVNLGVFGSAKAGNPTNPTATGTEAQIQAPAAYDAGWTAAVVTSRNFPPIEEVNGVLRTISYQNCYLLQEGVPAYDIGTEYSDTSIVKSITNNELSFYISQVDNNIGNSLTDTTKWVKAIFVGSSAVGVPQITLNFNLVNAPENCVWLEGAVDGIPGNAQGYDSDYPNLYAIYGTAYNDENTPTGKYKLPDFRDRVLWGGETAGYITAGLPNIKGYFGIDNTKVGGAFYFDGTHGGNNLAGGDTDKKVRFDASRPEAVAEQARGIYRDDCYTVQPPAIKFRAYTRYQ